MPTLAQLEKLLALDDADSFVLYAIAQEHAKLGDHDAAIGYYDRCIAVDPKQNYAYFHKARSLEAQSKSDAAIVTLRDGLANARATSDQKAAGEIAGYLESLGG
jgi:tetratricopeptide (TPR) repeat protein